MSEPVMVDISLLSHSARRVFVAWQEELHRRSAEEERDILFGERSWMLVNILNGMFPKLRSKRRLELLGEVGQFSCRADFLASGPAEGSA